MSVGGTSLSLRILTGNRSTFSASSEYCVYLQADDSRAIIIISEVTVGIEGGGQVLLDKTKMVYIYEYRRPT
jgi:hypothetical protein